MEDSRSADREYRERLCAHFMSAPVDELLSNVDCENEQIRYLSVLYLGSRDDQRVVPMLIAKMEDPLADIRETAAYALGHTHRAAEARSVLVDHLLNDESLHVRFWCALSLGCIGGPDTEIARALDDPEWRVKEGAIQTLMDLHSSWAADRIARMLDDESHWSVPYFAAMALLEFGISNEKIIETLRWLREDWVARDGALCWADMKICRNVQERFQDEVEELRHLGLRQAMDVLRERHGVEAVPRPPTDPIGDLLAKAERMLREQA